MVGMLKRTFCGGVLASAGLLVGRDAPAVADEKPQEVFRFVGQKKPFEVRGGDARYYTSLAPYQWEVAGVNFARDGVHNPAVDRYRDKACFEAVTETARLFALELATGLADPEQRLTTWFLDPKIGMLPSFQYAQMSPKGIAGGRAAGLLDARKIYTIVNVVLELRRASRSSGFCDQMVDWIARYQATITLNSINQIQRLGNNHWSWLLAQQIAMASLLGDESRFEELVAEAQGALKAQSGPGGQPLREMSRGNSLSHAVFNARAWSAVVMQVAAVRGGGYADAHFADALPLISFSLEGGVKPDAWAGAQNGPLSTDSLTVLSRAYESLEPVLRDRKPFSNREILMVGGLA